MLGNIKIGVIAKYDWRNSIPLFRYVLGISFVLLVASLMNYPLSYLTPVLALSYIAPGTKPISAKQGLIFILFLVIINFITFTFSAFFKDYPLVFIPLISLGVFWLYYTDSLPPAIKLFAIVSVFIIPLMSLELTYISAFVAINLVLNALMAVVLTQLVFLVLPWSNADEVFVKSMQQESKIPEYVRYINARKIFLVLFPVLLLFLVFRLSGGLLILIFIGILSMSPATSNAKMGSFLILANILGGLFAIIAYKLLVIVPMLPFLILITVLVGFIFGNKLFSKAKLAPIFGTGFSTFILILGTVTSSDDNAGSAVWSRLVQISIAVIYVVLAMRILNYYQGRKGIAA